MSEERNVKKSWRNEIKLKYYQDGKGNIYELKTELEQIMINDIIELTGKKNKLQNIINELEEYIKPYLYMLNGIQDRDIYEQCQLDDFTDIMEKLQELKENNK